MNPGGLRAALAPAPAARCVYEDLFAVQPFYNNLVTITLTGAQIVQLLEQQWLNQTQPRILQVSRGFGYTWDAAKPVGPACGAGQRDAERAGARPDGRATASRSTASWPRAATTSPSSARRRPRAPG